MMQQGLQAESYVSGYQVKLCSVAIYGLKAYRMTPHAESSVCRRRCRPTKLCVSFSTKVTPPASPNFYEEEASRDRRGYIKCNPKGFLNRALCSVYFGARN